MIRFTLAILPLVLAGCFTFEVCDTALFADIGEDDTGAGSDDTGYGDTAEQIDCDQFTSEVGKLHNEVVVTNAGIIPTEVEPARTSFTAFWLHSVYAHCSSVAIRRIPIDVIASGLPPSFFYLMKDDHLVMSGETIQTKEGDIVAYLDGVLILEPGDMGRYVIYGDSSNSVEGDTIQINVQPEIIAYDTQGSAYLQSDEIVGNEYVRGPSE